MRHTVLIPNDKKTGLPIKARKHTIPDVFESGRAFIHKIYFCEEFDANNFVEANATTPADGPQLLSLRFIGGTALPVILT